MAQWLNEQIMSRNTVKFELAHSKFKTTQFSAFHAYGLLFDKEDIEPEEVLEDTYIETVEGWIKLDSSRVIAAQIFHPEQIEAPLSVLMRLIAKVREVSCSSMYNWEHIKVPKRFVSSANSVEAPRGIPILSTLIVEKLATLHELQSVYSLDDALRMYDDFTANNINKALSQEKAMNDAKSKR
jgi:hypothetical protein